MEKKVLIEILLDKSEDLAVRDDVAMDLKNFPEEETEKALMLVAVNNDEDEMLLDSCGESLAVIWLEKDKLDQNNIKLLSPIAFHSALSIIKARKPGWIQKYSLDNLK